MTSVIQKSPIQETKEKFLAQAGALQALKEAASVQLADGGWAVGYEELDIMFFKTDKRHGVYSYEVLSSTYSDIVRQRKLHKVAPNQAPVAPKQAQSEAPEHKAMRDLVKLLKARLLTMLVGPAGSGKTTACKLVAAELGLEFLTLSVCSQSTKSDLFGFRDATGTYQTTSFRIAFEQGGIFLLDEVDAGNPNVLTALNSAIENRMACFPDGKKVIAHEDFICCASANTFGSGADLQYVGRNKLDAATLDRFAMLYWDYDQAQELRISSNRDWTLFVQKTRAKASRLGLRVVISPRASINGGKALAAGIERTKVEELYLWKGMDSDTRQKLGAPVAPKD